MGARAHDDAELPHWDRERSGLRLPVKQLGAGSCHLGRLISMAAADEERASRFSRVSAAGPSGHIGSRSSGNTVRLSASSDASSSRSRKVPGRIHRPSGAAAPARPALRRPRARQRHLVRTGDRAAGRAGRPGPNGCGDRAAGPAGSPVRTPVTPSAMSAPAGIT